MHRPLPAEAKPIGFTLTREARRWFVTSMISVDAATQHPKPDSACGIDIGTGNRLTFSDGTHLEPFRPNRRKAAALHRAARALVRCQKDSRRRRKVRDRLGQAYRAIRNTRANHTHQDSATAPNTHTILSID